MDTHEPVPSLGRMACSSPGGRDDERTSQGETAGTIVKAGRPAGGRYDEIVEQADHAGKKKRVPGG
jgi:hypothetical protein